MDVQLMRISLSLLLLNFAVEATNANENETLSVDLRQPRVTGRIIKLYSGTKPEPIFCAGEGFQADPVECAVFYRCVRAASGKYTVFRFQCGPGTVYDPDTEVCNHPRSTKRSECGGMVAPTLEHSHENEIDGSKHEMPSPIRTIKPVYTERTTTAKSTSLSTSYPWATSKRQISEVLSTSSRTVASSATTLGYQSSAPSTATTLDTRQPNSKNGDICTSDGFMGDSENCRKFYRCVGNQRGGFVKYEFSCSESTIWDEDSQSCNHPWAVQRRRCGRGGTQTDKPSSGIDQVPTNDISPDPTIQQQTQISFGSKVQQTQSQISKGPVIQNQTQINFGDRINGTLNSSSKQNQTQIASGSAVSQTQTQINYGNKGVQTQLQIDHSKESSQSQTQFYKSTSTKGTTIQSAEIDSVYGSQTTSKGPDDQENNNECSESGFMGDKNDCKKFYRCVDNGKGSYIKYEFACGEGTVWDSSQEACNHAWAVKECGGKAPVAESVTPSVQVTTTSTASPDNYYTTQETTTTEEEEDDLQYGNQNQQPPATSTQAPTETTTTEASKHEETECNSSGFIGDDNDCKKFYRCVDNGRGSYTKYEYKCGEGTVWDPDIEACNHAWAVKKCGGTSSNDINKIDSTTTSSQSTVITTVALLQTTTQHSVESEDYDTGYGNNNDVPTSKSTTTTTNTTIKQPQAQGDNTGNVCQSSGFMGDKNDCKKFYRCVDSGNGAFIRYEFSCGEGTVWDPKIEACNHAWAVEKCGNDETADVYKETTSRPQSTLSDNEVDTVQTTQKEKETNPTTTLQSVSSSSTTEAAKPGSDLNNDVCNSEGFVGDRTDCKKFYRCVNNQNGGFIKYEFSCGEGTVWDSEINACNHDKNVKSPCSTSTQSENIDQGSTQTSTSQSISVSTENQQSESTESQSNQATPKPNPTKQPSSEKQCTQEGFMGDDKDCRKFYRCVDNGKNGFTKYEFSCGEGTVWDSEIDACNHPSPDKSCSTTSAANGTGSTSKEPVIEYDEMVTEAAPNEITSSSITTSTEQSSSEVSQKPQSSSGSCSSEGFYGDPNNCKKFYRCVDNGKGGFTKYDFDCGDGTVWDQEIQACNHDTSDCLKSTINTTQSSASQSEVTESSTNTSTTSPLSEHEQSTQGTEHPVQSTSTSQCTSEGFYANPNDCKKFFRCVSNGNGGFTKYDFSCGEGTIWVQDIQGCDHDNDISSCTKQNASIQTTSQKPEEQQSSSESSSATTSSQSEKPNKEDDEYQNESSTKPTSSADGDNCASEGFYANKNDCKRFYRCVDNGNGGYTKYDFTCGEGTAWDSDIQNCNHISEVRTCRNSQSEENQSNNVVQDEEASQTTDNAGQSSSSTTENSEAISSSSTTASSGSTSESSNSANKPSSQDTCEQEGYYGNKQDCTKFYRCVDNGKGGFTKYDFDCGEGTIWDQDITTCNHPQDVSNPSCQQSDSGGDGASSSQATSSSPSPSSTASSSSSNSSQSSTESSSQNSSDCSQEDSSKKPANQNVTCTKAGYYADPNDCKKFYRCVDWDGDGKRFSVYHFDCGEGTIWDPALDTCNHEDSVYPPRDCSGAQSQNENINQESSTTEESTTTTQKETTNSQEGTTNTQQSTTNEQSTTTTQQTTTSERTTTQQSTTKSTTQESTTTDQTTTQQSTSSEKTTTQQTTSEQTTEQQTTEQPTTEQQTTQQQTTQQQTTTQQTTEQQTTEQQTTEQQTTSEQTTTQHTTSSDQTTTQQTTEQQTTSQQPSTTEPSTTEQTSDQSTTNDSGEQSTTDQSSTNESTTEESSTESTTSQTTDSGTTEDSTSTTSQQTDDTSTTEGGQDTTTENGQDSTTEGGQESTTESSSSSEKDCPETEEDQNVFVCPTSFRRHPKYCNLFYQCTEDDDNHDVKIAVFNCPNNTIYDESKTQCVEENKADKKCNGEIAQKRRVKRLDAMYKEPIEVSKERLKCPAVGHFPFEKEECSSAFLKCQKAKSGKLRGYVYQCPEGYVYWSVSRRCEAKSNVRDCKRSYNNWSGRWEIPIERRNVAP